MKLSLVKCDDYNGHKDTLWIMRDTDYRFGKDYHPLCGGTFVKSESRRYPRPFLCDNGSRFLVFSDWSAKEVQS